MRARATLPAIVAAVLILGSSAGLAGPAAAAPQPPVPEILALKQSLTLDADHVGNIRIEADGVVLDCAGHAVKGPGGPTAFIGGIVFDGRRNVTVRRCVVSGFTYNGIAASGTDVRIEDNTLVGNAGDGVHLTATVGGVVTGNTARANGGRGFAILASAEVTVTDNVATDHRDGAGFAFLGTRRSVVADNIATRDDGGFVLGAGDDGTASSGDMFVRNSASSTGAGFVVLAGATGNTFTANVANRNAREGFAVRGAGNTFSGNTANLDRDGFALVGANGNVLTRNTANGGRRYGFVVTGGSSDNVLVRNAALGNARYDALQAGTGTGNAWVRNRFRRTSGI